MRATVVRNRRFALLGVVAFVSLSLVGFGCSGGDGAEQAADPVEDAGKPALPERERPNVAGGIEEISKGDALLVSTETATSSSLHLYPEEGDRTTLAEDASLAPYPYVSPDGSTLSYLALRDGEFDVGLFDVRTRETTYVEDAVFGGSDVELAWNRSGTRFVSRRMNGLAADSRLLLFHFDGSGEQRIAEDDAATSDVQPVFSPDGSRLAFRRVSADIAALQDPALIEDGQVHVYSLETGEVSLLLEHVRAFAWTTDDRLVVHRMTDSATGLSPLQVVSIHGGEPEALVPDASSFAMGTDDKTIAYASGGPAEGYDVTTFDVESKEELASVSEATGVPFLRRATQLTLSEDGSEATALLTSGSRVSSKRRPGTVTFIDFDDKLTRTIAENAFAPVISPDGKTIAYETEEESDAAVESGLGTFSTVWTRGTSPDDEATQRTGEGERTSHQYGWTQR